MRPVWIGVGKESHATLSHSLPIFSWLHATLLTTYIFFIQSEAFDLEYLCRVVDVKDTVNKAPLMLHLVELVIEKFPNSSDLYSDLPSVHRVAKVNSCMKVIIAIAT